MLVFKVAERPVLTSVTYEDNKIATRTADRGPAARSATIALQLGKPLDMGTVFFAETAIRDLLAEKGFLDAEVEADVQPGDRDHARRALPHHARRQDAHPQDRLRRATRSSRTAGCAESWS